MTSSAVVTPALALLVTVSPLAILGAILWQWHRGDLNHAMRLRRTAHAKR